MRWVFSMFAAAVILGAWCVVPARSQQVVDRIVARVEDDILTQSELRELGRFQQLVQGRAESGDKLLVELIEQWAIHTEAAAAHFPHPIDAEVDGAVQRLEAQAGGPQAYQARLRELQLPAAAVRRFVERQLYLSRYLDYKFRPVAQVDSAAVEKYYREELLPPLAARGQPAPPLDRVQDQIRELLTQRGISERAARWLEETKSRLKIKIPEPASAGSPR